MKNLFKNDLTIFIYSVFSKIKLSFLYEKFLFLTIFSEYKGLNNLEIGPGIKPYLNKKKDFFLDKFNYNKGSYKNFYQSEATDIPFKDGYFDLVISAHCLEHLPNPILAIKEWSRVIKKNGFIIFILPHNERMFDHGRKLTTLDHLLEDYEKNADYSDQKHFEEFEEISSKQYNHNWIKFSKNEDGTLNFNKIVRDGNIHYHVWNQNTFIELLTHLKFKINVVIEKLPFRQDSFLVVVEKI